MHDVEIEQVLQPTDELPHYDSALLLREGTVDSRLFELIQIAPVAQVRKDVEVGMGLVELPEPDNMLT